MKVRMDNVSYRRGEWQLTADAVFKTGVHIVTGRIGSGKSTLSLILADIIRPDNGSINLKGISSKTLSLQFPEYHVTGYTINDEISSWKLKPTEVLAKAGLSGRGNEKTLQLSGGEMKRLHLTCQLSKDWDLLILDEPFSSLDCIQKQKLCRELESRNNCILIILTHEQNILPKVDYIWEMDGGHLRYIGEVAYALEKWDGAPGHIRHALSKGVLPDNIREKDAMEALCRMQD